MDIRDRVAELRNDHLRKYGSEPNVIYVGITEFYTMRKECNLMMQICVQGNTNFAGMRVVRVMEDYYLQVGRE